MKYADLVIRNGHVPPETPNGVVMEVELVSMLEPLQFVDALDHVESLTVEWEPDEALTRDSIRVRGELDVDQVRLLAHALVPNLDELVNDMESWYAGPRGLAQVVVLHAISARLRSVQSQGEAA